MAIKTNRKHAEMYIEIGNNIAYYRKHKNLTQEQLAKMAGISKQYLRAIEAPNIVQAISLETLFAISAALGIKPDILLIDRNLLEKDITSFSGNNAPETESPDTAPPQ